MSYSGNLRVETDGVSTTNVHLTNSYLVSFTSRLITIVLRLVKLDTSDALVNWVNKSGFNIIDVNVLAQLPTEFAKVCCPHNHGMMTEMDVVWT